MLKQVEMSKNKGMTDANWTGFFQLNEVNPCDHSVTYRMSKTVVFSGSGSQ